MDNRKIVFTSYNSEKFERTELLDLDDLIILQDRRHTKYRSYTKGRRLSGLSIFNSRRNELE